LYFVTSCPIVFVRFHCTAEPSNLTPVLSLVREIMALIVLATEKSAQPPGPGVYSSYRDNNLSHVSLLRGHGPRGSNCQLQPPGREHKWLPMEWEVAVE
jgi:hypothetical protein